MASVSLHVYKTLENIFIYFVHVCLLYVHIFSFLFRKCGADVITLESNEKHDRAAEIARRDNRVIITSGVYCCSITVSDCICMNIHHRKFPLTVQRTVGRTILHR